MTDDEFAVVYMEYWKNGKSPKDLGTHINRAKSSINARAVKLRKKGFDLPSFQLTFRLSDREFLDLFWKAHASRTSADIFCTQINMPREQYQLTRQRLLKSGTKLPQLKFRECESTVKFKKLWAEAVELDETLEHIIKHTGFSYNHIAQLRRKYGLPSLRKRKQRKPFRMSDEEFVLAMKKIKTVGGTIQNLADLLKISIQQCNCKMKGLAARNVERPTLTKRRVNQHEAEFNKFQKSSGDAA